MFVEPVMIFSRSPWYSSSARLLRLAVVLTIIAVFTIIPQQVSTAQASWQWYKTDTHIHSAVSADAYPDLGVLTATAKAAGYNAIFVTDHNLASNFPANGVANLVPFEDSYLHLFTGTFGTQTATVNELVTTPINTGTKSLHMVSTSTGPAETATWAIRGPSLRSGDIILKVSIYPTRIDSGSGAYVSVSIGGDPRATTSPVGYTTQAGVISPGKTTVLVWQLGTARTPSTDPNARVLTYSLGSYTLNAWNHYTINVSNYLSDIPTADRPLDYNGLSYLKMAAASNGGTANVYFDTYSVQASAPLTPANEFVYRSSIISAYNTSAFKTFPSLEMGNSKHANRFDFGITSASQFVSYLDGVDGILPTQQGGYPAQLNHPDSSGGVTMQEAIDNQGYGADFMEVPRHQTWIDIWDAILNQGFQLLGSGSTDKHTASYSTASDSTYIYAPALDFDLLIRSMFEGRTFMASGFSGPAIFNLDSGSQDPYPARYPVYVSDTQASANVRLRIPAGMNSSYTVSWIRNGIVIATDPVTGTSYNVAKSISLAGATTYVRAEVRSSGGSIRALTQPIFFKDVSSLPEDKHYHIDSVVTTNGRGYSRVITKGVTASAWDDINETLSLTLENSTGSLVEMQIFTNSAPQEIRVNNTVVSPAASLTAFDAGTGSSWFYDTTAALLHLKVKHASGAASVLADFSALPPAASTCRTSTGPSSAYTVTVCIDAPANGATVSGVRSVTASVTTIGTNPGVAKLVFYLGGEYLLTDFQTPFDFKLPTTKFVDGTRTLEVEAIMRDGFTSQRAGVSLRFNNGITQPPVNNKSFTPKSGTTPPSGQSFTLVAAGDGAGGMQNASAVSDMIASWSPNLFLYLGDVYEKGTPSEFYNWYGTTSTLWGRFRSVTNPIVGNHEYAGGASAPGYFDYWDNVPNYYSFDAAGWHFIAINSNCIKVGGCQVGSPQYQWVAADLAAHSNTCTIAFYHHPVYFVGPIDDPQNMNAIWALLAQNGVDMVLNGHDHSYQRWKPLDGNAAVSSSGVTEFVVGGSGHGIQQFALSDNRLAFGADSADSFGALRLQLNQHGAGYQYINTAGIVLDSGSVACSGAPADNTAPSTPTNLSATSSASNAVNLTWKASTDNVGVTGYDIFRNGVQITTAPPNTNFTDTTVVSNTTYSYQIRARDAAGKLSGMSNSASVTTAGLLFIDGFESGNFSQWTSATGLTIQQQQVYAGLSAARGTSTGTPAYAYKQLSQTQSNLYYRLWFKVLSQGSNQVYLQRFRTAANGAIMGVYINNVGKLGYRNDVTGLGTVSSTVVTPGVWHELQTRVRINGASGQVEIWLDGVRIDELSKTENFGSSATGRVQLGENSSGRTFDIALDRVALGTSFIDSANPPEGGSTLPTSTPTPTTTPGPTSTPTPTGTPNVQVPGKATLVSPNGNNGTSNPTYTWNRVSGASWYFLWVNGPSGTVIQKWYTAAQANCNNTTCSISDATPGLAAGTYTWWIQTWNDGGYGPWSEGMPFSTDQGASAPQLIIGLASELRNAPTVPSSIQKIRPWSRLQL